MVYVRKLLTFTSQFSIAKAEPEPNEPKSSSIHKSGMLRRNVETIWGGAIYWGKGTRFCQSSRGERKTLCGDVVIALLRSLSQLSTGDPDDRLTEGVLRFRVFDNLPHLRARMWGGLHSSRWIRVNTKLDRGWD